MKKSIFITLCSIYFSSLSAQPYLVKDINTGSGNSIDFGAAPGTCYNGFYYFVANNGTNGAELWRTDGTAGNTTLVKDIRPGSAGSNIQKLTVAGGILFFMADDGTNGTELWKTDGTVAGTVMVKNANPGNTTIYYSDPLKFFEYNGKLFYVFNDGTQNDELWMSDGTSTGTVRVKDINAGAGGSGISCFEYLGNYLYFPAYDGTTRGLWKTDGTETGTVQVKGMNKGNNSSYIDSLRNFNGYLWYFGDAGTGQGTELWRSDGTTIGTALFKDIYPGSNSGLPYLFTVSGSTMYFVANNGDNAGDNFELWKTDGTPGGTVMVKDLRTGSGSSPAKLTVFGSKILFIANDNATGFERELFISDGTSDGTFKVKKINPTDNSSVEGFAVCGDIAYFTANDGTYGQELWKTNGTDAGTTLVANINPAGGFTIGARLPFGGCSNRIYFVGNNGTNGDELFAIQCSPVLPVQLLDFGAQVWEKTSVKLNWKTGTEENNQGFEVEYGTDAQHFTRIGWVNAAGSGQYNFVHATPANGINYYRLVQYDKNGKKTTSKQVALSIISKGKWSVYPNPASNRIWISDMNSGKASFKIFNVNGTLVEQGKYQNNGIDISRLNNGYFILVFENGSQVVQLPFHKQVQ